VTPALKYHIIPLGYQVKAIPVINTMAENTVLPPGQEILVLFRYEYSDGSYDNDYGLGERPSEIGCRYGLESGVRTYVPTTKRSCNIEPLSDFTDGPLPDINALRDEHMSDIVEFWDLAGHSLVNTTDEGKCKIDLKPMEWKDAKVQIGCALWSQQCWDPICENLYLRYKYLYIIVNMISEKSYSLRRGEVP
jgi:hypothetical protein